MKIPINLMAKAKACRNLGKFNTLTKYFGRKNLLTPPRVEILPLIVKKTGNLNFPNGENCPYLNMINNSFF